LQATVTVAVEFDRQTTVAVVAVAAPSHQCVTAMSYSPFMQRGSSPG